MVKAAAICQRFVQRHKSMLQSPSSIETRDSWVVASVALLTMMMAFGAAWIIAVALKDIAAEAGGARSIPALASSLAWLGSGIGGILMGQIAERVGTRWTVIFGALMIALLTLVVFLLLPATSKAQAPRCIPSGDTDAACLGNTGCTGGKICISNTCQ